MKKIQLNKLALKNIMSVGAAMVKLKKYPTDRQMIKQQQMNERIYFTELIDYIKSQKEKSRIERDTTLDVLIDTNIVNDLNKIIGALPE